MRTLAMIFAAGAVLSLIAPKPSTGMPAAPVSMAREPAMSVPRVEKVQYYYRPYYRRYVYRPYYYYSPYYHPYGSCLGCGWPYGW
jgi:hypothetical protein